MDISRDAAGMNITVREDYGVAEPTAIFLFPLGKIFQLFSRVQKQNAKKKCDSHWCSE